MLETYIDDGVERFLVHDLAAVHLCWMSLQTCSLLRGVDPHNLNLLYLSRIPCFNTSPYPIARFLVRPWRAS